MEKIQLFTQLPELLLCGNDNGIIYDKKEVLIEDDIVADSVIAKMLEHGNKVYNSITELKEAINIR